MFPLKLLLHQPVAGSVPGKRFPPPVRMSFALTVTTPLVNMFAEVYHSLDYNHRAKRTERGSTHNASYDPSGSLSLSILIDSDFEGTKIKFRLCPISVHGWAFRITSSADQDHQDDVP